MLAQVIEPLSRNRPAHYQRYDWPTQPLAEWRVVTPEPVVLVEGVTAARSEWRQHLTFVIWIDTPPDVRLARGFERDGPDALESWRTWMAAEDLHDARDHTRDRADVIVDGTAPLLD